MCYLEDFKKADSSICIFEVSNRCILVDLAHSLISQPLGYCYSVLQTESGDSLKKRKQNEKIFRSLVATISCRSDLNHHHICASQSCQPWDFCLQQR